MYNGPTKVHSMKFKSIATPNGLIATLYGPVESKRHNSVMLARSKVLNQLQEEAPYAFMAIPRIFSDFTFRVHFTALLTDLPKAWNKSMSEVRFLIEWIFGDVVKYFKFLDFKRNSKLCSSAVGKVYILCALLHNSRACLCGAITSKFFQFFPTTVHEYFQKFQAWSIINQFSE